MPATALLKFRQGTYIGANGRALIVEGGTIVTIENSSNTGVQSYRIELLYAEPNSLLAVLPGVQPPRLLAEGNGIPAAAFIPDADVYGCYRIRLTVWDGANFTGQQDVDIRNVAVPTPTRRFVKPPYQRFPDPLPLTGSGVSGEKPDELNFDDARLGWSGPVYTPGQHSFRLVNAVLEELDTVGPLVSETTDGEVSSFTPSQYGLLTTDGQTAGGSWSKLTSGNSDSFIDPAALGLDRLQSGGATSGQFLYWDGTTWTPENISLLPAGSQSGQVLYWNGASWIPSILPPELPAGSTVGQVLSWDGVQWQPSTPPQPIPFGSTPGQLTYWGGVAWAITATAPTSGDVPIWNGTTWTFGPVELPAGENPGEVLTWDGTEWGPAFLIPSGSETGQILYWDDVRWARTSLSPSVGDYLRWDGNSWRFEPFPSGTAAGQLAVWDGTSLIVSTNDTPSLGDYPVWDGFDWNFEYAKYIPSGDTDGQLMFWSAGAWEVNTSYAPDTGDTPVWNGTAWTFSEPTPIPTGTYSGQLMFWRSTGPGTSVGSLEISTTEYPANNEVPIWNGTTWTFGIPGPQGTMNGQLAYWHTGALRVTTTAPSIYQFPRWDGTTWTFTYLPTVAYGSAVGQYLYWNGSQWINGSIPLVSSASSGFAAANPASGSYLFGTTGTAGGTWTRNINSYIDDLTIAPAKIIGAVDYVEDYYFLESYDGTPRWTGVLRKARATFEVENLGSAGSLRQIDWSSSTKQEMTLSSASCTVTFVDPPGPTHLTLRVAQDLSGGRTIVWPSNVRASGGNVLLGGLSGRSTIFSFWFDGTNYYVSSVVNITTASATTQLV